MKDPVEIQLPGGDGLLVILRVYKSRQWIPSTFLDDLLLDSGYGSAIGGAVSRHARYFIYYDLGWTHVVNCPIASYTDRLSSFVRLSFIPRSRALHTSAQARPSST